MPQLATNLFNNTIAASLVRGATPPDSLSLRITGLEAGKYAKIYDIVWGIISSTETGLTDFDFGVLQIIRNEVFDPSFVYGTIASVQTKDVVYQDVITRDSKFHQLKFDEPFKLDDGSNYLIIFPAPTDITLTPTYDCCLTVHGELCGYKVEDSIRQGTIITDDKR